MSPPSKPSPPEQELSLGSLHPLRAPAFRALWLAAIFSYTGTWVQDVGEQWLMLSLTSNPLLVAMLASAIALPATFLLIPAGVMADRLDRRRLLMVAQGWMALVALALGVVTLGGWATPALLLTASFSLGIGSALTSPAWQSLVPELVPREQMAEAVTLNSLSFNIARAVGPALGGLFIAASGPSGAFVVNAISFLAVIEVLRRWPQIRLISRRPRGDPSEPLRSAVTAAFQHVRRSAALRAVFLAVAMFGVAASSVSPLLSVFAKHVLGAGSFGYGTLVGCFGAGAVLGAFVLGRLRAALSARALVSGAMALFGACALWMATTHSLGLAAALLVPAGVGWIASMATCNALVQLSAPRALKARVLSLYQMVWLFAWSLGAMAGGSIARHFDVRVAISVGALGTIGAAFVTARLRIPAYGGESEYLVTPQPVPVRVG
jgi:MFS family permease